MQSTSTEAPTREAVKRFTNKILFLSYFSKTQFMQGARRAGNGCDT